MDDEFIQVRLRRATAACLKAFARAMQRLAERGRIRAPVHPSHGLTLDTAVAILLERYEKSARRNARHNSKQKAARLAKPVGV